MKKLITSLFLLLGVFLVGFGVLMVLPQDIRNSYPKILNDILASINTYGERGINEVNKYIYLGNYALPWICIVVVSVQILLSLCLIFVMKSLKIAILMILLLSGTGFSVFTGINTDWETFSSIGFFGLPVAVTVISLLGLLVFFKKS